MTRLRSRSVLPLLLLAVAAGASSVACKKTQSLSAPLPLSSEAGTMVQVPFGGSGDPEDIPHVGFRIEAEHPKTTPVAHAPWYQAGGDWTFYDARTEGGVPFGFGIQVKTGSSQRFSFGKAMLTVPDAQSGAKLVSAFARAFHGKMPREVSAQPLVFKPFSMALLGGDMRRLPGGGFDDQPGTWQATKLFLQRNNLEAEVFFNYDPVSKAGEFSEKDSDYADEMVAFLAGELRDGPRPRRTPETDPSIVLAGPKLDGMKRVGPAGAKPYGFLDKGSRYAVTVKGDRGTRLLSYAVATGADEIEVARVEHDLGQVRCAAAVCLVEESVPKEKGSLSSEDPRHFFVVDRKAGTSTLLEGPWGEKGTLAGEPFSPDGAMIAMLGWKKKATGAGQYLTAYIAPRAGAPGDVKAVDLGEDSADVVGWTGQGATLRATVRKGPYLEPAKQTFFTVDPRTGVATPAPSKAAKGAKADADDEGRGPLSPDGKRRVECTGGEAIVITDVATKTARTFTVHPDDQHAFRGGEGCIPWLSARYLRFQVGERLGFLDADTLKVSFLDEETYGGAPWNLELSSDFKVAVLKADDGVKLGKIVVR